MKRGTSEKGERSMHLWQAVILGGFYWFSYCGVFPHTLNLLFYQPLTASLLVGVVMGDVPTAMIVGATIQPMFLGQTNWNRKGEFYDYS